MSHSDDAVLKAIARRKAQKTAGNSKVKPAESALEAKESNSAPATIINPQTNRPMKVGGRAHKAYLKSQNSTSSSTPVPRSTSPAHLETKQTTEDTRKTKKRKTVEEEAEVDMTDAELEKLIGFAQTFLPEATVNLLFS